MQALVERIKTTEILSGEQALQMGPLPRIGKTTSPLVRVWTAKEPESKKARASGQEDSQGGAAGNCIQHMRNIIEKIIAIMRYIFI
jgi:hypothetical protein